MARFSFCDDRLLIIPDQGDIFETVYKWPIFQILSMKEKDFCM